MLASGDSFGSEDNEKIQKHSLVIAYVSPKVMKHVYVSDSEDHIVQFTTGTYHTSDWIGKDFGVAVYPRKAKADVQPLYLLAPTPELWTRVLNHRTQILYLADISLITTFLELKPGSVVLESGTGSGSLTHSLARAVAPTGHVHSFEFHQDRCAVATDEFSKNGISDVVSVVCRDVQTDGFPDCFHEQADAVFLDLPEPWKAIEAAVSCLKPNCCLMTFSPCVEQIQRTCDRLHGTEVMMDVRVMECISREYRVKGESLVTDLNLYHQQLVNRKRKLTDSAAKNSGQESDCSRMVTNSKVVSLKGHTGFLVLARKFVR